MLAGSAAFGAGKGPQSDAVNPALSATVQRTTLDASYLALAGLGGEANEDRQGHVVNLGLLLPTRVGVFGGTAHFINSPLNAIPLGTSFLLHLTAAKELYPGWSAGTGLRMVVGSADQFDFGLALDLGVVRETGPNALLPGLTWGIAVTNIGKWYEPISGKDPLPAPFTPNFGFRFTPVRTEWLDVGVGTTLRFPGFRNVATDISTSATFFDAVTLHAGWQVDLLQTIDGRLPSRSLLPSFGLSVSFTAGLGEEGFAAEQGWTETEIQTSFAAAPLYDGVWALGGGINAPLGVIDREGPKVTVDYPTTTAFSPNNDGAKDALTVPISITDDRFIVEWAFTIEDQSGDLVRTLQNIDTRPENTGLQSFVDRVLAVRSGVPIPEQIRWDGRRDDGSKAADGEYRFSLTAVDDNGNVGASGQYDVVLDNTAPEIAIRPLSADELIFSPNDDGNKDVITIAQEGSVEEQWNAAIVSASGREVRSFSSIDDRPTDVVWDGRDNEGVLQPDGVYRYEIAATDAAGNTTESSVANIIVDTEPTPVGVTISTGHFSPDNDGTKDTVSISPDIPVTVGLTEWEVAILDSAGNTVRQYTEITGNPRALSFDGRDGNQELLSEGRYSAELRVLYRNGNRPIAQSATFVLDITDPVATVRSDIDLFSPNGDKIIDDVTFAQEASAEEAWQGIIFDNEENVVRLFEWNDVPPTTVSWNGRRDDGRLAADGVYRYVLSSTDRAGNRGASAPVFVEIDTSGADLALQAVFAAFSPNADGTLDEQQFDLQTDRPEAVTEMVLEIKNESNVTVWQTAANRFLSTVDWNGTAPDGTAVPDGEYSANVGITLANGTTNTAGTATFTLDRTPPSIDLTLAYTLFSPDGDGNRDALIIEQASSNEEQWNAVIRSATGDVVQEYTFRGIATDLEWTGTDEAGNTLPDGVYSYKISAQDAAGNEVSREVTGIRIDTRQPRLFVTAGSSGISPNGDGIRESVDFELYANLLDGAEGWRLTIRDEGDRTIREFTGSTIRPQQTIGWDGRDEQGNVSEGTMRAEYAIDYIKGNQPRAVSSEVIVDITPPQVSIDLSPLPFSPDNDGVDDSLTIAIDVEDRSDIEAWRFEILDRNDRFFNEFTGRGTPASELIWDGKASDGELVISAEDYPYRFVIGDELGNVTREQGFIPVDILVIRDGDRLRVQIANINFAPNSPALVLDPQNELGARNIAIIQRLGEVFEKYSTYNIRIEGHAVNVTGTEQEEREQLQPLSLQRAETVRQALVDQGIAGRRITTLGRGGTEPVVPHTDLENRWKNRRVEFILIR